MNLGLSKKRFASQAIKFYREENIKIYETLKEILSKLKIKIKNNL